MLLAPRQETTDKRLPFVVTYHPSLPNKGGILCVLYLLLHSFNRCKQAIKGLLMMTIWFSLRYDLEIGKLRVPEEFINVLATDVMFIIILLLEIGSLYSCFWY